LLCSSFILIKISSVIADEEKQIKNGKRTAEGEEEGEMTAERYIYVPENEEATEFSFCFSHRSAWQAYISSG